MKTPDITPVQIVAVAKVVIGVLVAFNMDISVEQQGALLNLVTVVAGVLIAGDAVIRNGRSRNLKNKSGGHTPKPVHKNK